MIGLESNPQHDMSSTTCQVADGLCRMFGGHLALSEAARAAIEDSEHVQRECIKPAQKIKQITTTIQFGIAPRDLRRLPYLGS